MEKYPGKKRIAVFISGRGSNLKSLIKYSHKKNSLIKIILVISNNPNAKGLKYSTKSNIKSYGIKFKGKSDFEIKSLKLLKKNNVDMLCLAGFMNILSGSFIRKFSKPILNIHPSLLPKYPGLNTHKRALDSGDKVHGTTIHYVTSELDCGPIIRQEQINIEPNDDENALMERIKKIENLIYPEEISKLKI